MELTTDRLILIPASVEFLRASLDRDFATADACHQITVPPTWPGHRDAIEGLPIHFRALQADPRELLWRIRLVVLRDDRIAIGSVDLKGPPIDGDAEIGWGILPSMRRMGFATEATAAVVGWVAAQPGVTRITATIADDNLASIRLAHRLGLAKTAELRRGLPIYLRGVERV